MHPLLLGFLLLILIAIIGLIFWAFLTFHPASTQKLPIDDPRVDIFALKDRNVNAWVVKSSNQTIMIDAGMGEPILKGLTALNLRIEDISNIFLTHSDYDHTGTLEKFPNAAIYLSGNEEALITEKVARFGKNRYNSITRKDYQLLTTEDPILLGTLEIQPIFTPGHTRGHTAYLINKIYLFTGDTLRLLPSGKIIPFIRFINMDTPQQLASIKRLETIMVENSVKLIATGHSGYKILN